MRFSVLAADPGLNAALGQGLIDHHAEGAVGSTLYAVVGAEPPKPLGRALHRLYAHDGQIVHRSSDPRRTLNALASHLGYYALTSDDRLGFFAALALVRDDEALVVPIELWSQLPRLAKAAQQAGYALADAPGVAIDAASGELIIAEPLFDADLLGLEAAGEPAPFERPVVAPVAAPGSYRIRTWVVRGEPHQPADDLVLWDTWSILKRAQGFATDRLPTMTAARTALLGARVERIDPVTPRSLRDLLASVG